ncbi:hypothetical protein [Effusibacillus consociatus]|uniref:Pilus assembly protein n=1 Tax=Effusibacillus consociatus TaxID=1117041 RepID=A0ABV9Q3D7_9BACL
MRRFWKDIRGSVFLEHAFLTIPLLLIGVLLLSNAALFFHAYQVVSSASASGARTAARVEDAGRVTEAIRKELQAGAISTTNPEFEASRDVRIQFRDGEYSTVTVYYRFQFPFSLKKFGIAIDDTIPFHATSSFPREWGS